MVAAWPRRLWSASGFQALVTCNHIGVSERVQAPSWGLAAKRDLWASSLEKRKKRQSGKTISDEKAKNLRVLFVALTFGRSVTLDKSPPF